MKIIPVLIINLRDSRVEMADLHATTILYIWILLKYYALGADHLMRWIFIEPNNLLIKPPNAARYFSVVQGS
jgi:hypothetical protein